MTENSRFFARINEDSISEVLYSTMSSLPITLCDFKNALKDLSDEHLLSVLSQLQLSLKKLQETNDELSKEIESTTDAGDLKLFEETIEENKVVIENQQKRLTTLESELKIRGFPRELEQGMYL